MSIHSGCHIDGLGQLPLVNYTRSDVTSLGISTALNVTLRPPISALNSICNSHARRVAHTSTLPDTAGPDPHAPALSLCSVNASPPVSYSSQNVTVTSTSGSIFSTSSTKCCSLLNSATRSQPLPPPPGFNAKLPLRSPCLFSLFLPRTQETC